MITVVVGYARGFGAITPPLLAIPAEKYYFYEAFFQIPVFFAAAVLFAGVVRLLARTMNGVGTFEDTFAFFCLTLTLPMFILLWVPESTLIIFFPEKRLQPLGGFDMFPYWVDIVRQLASIIWPLVITALGVARIEHVSLVKSAFLAFVAFIPVAFLLAIFIR